MQKIIRKHSQLKWLFIFVIALVVINTGIPGVLAKEAKAPVDINTASQKDLEGIKGVGAATAKKIIDNRPYKSVDELSKAGLSAKKIEALKPFVTVGSTGTPHPAKGETKPLQTPAPPEKATVKTGQPKATAGATAQKSISEAGKQTTAAKLAPGEKVNLNSAEKEKLEALPGIGPVKAQAIIDGRPYKAPEDVMKVKGIKQGTFNKIKDLITVK